MEQYYTGVSLLDMMMLGRYLIKDNVPMKIYYY